MALLTTAEAAARLGVSADTIRALAHARQLAVVRLSAGWKAQMRFRPEDLDAFVAAHLTPAKYHAPPPAPARHPVRDLPGARRYLA